MKIMMLAKCRVKGFLYFFSLTIPTSGRARIKCPCGDLYYDRIGRVDPKKGKEAYHTFNVFVQIATI